MINVNDLTVAMGAMLPFVAVYYFGVAIRIGRENQNRPEGRKGCLGLQEAGEALPGLFESVVTLAAVFGLAIQSTAPSNLFQHIGLVASAGFLAFRGGYTYQESLLKSVRQPAAEADVRSARNV